MLVFCIAIVSIRENSEVAKGLNYLLKCSNPCDTGLVWMGIIYVTISNIYPRCMPGLNFFYGVQSIMTSQALQSIARWLQLCPSLRRAVALFLCLPWLVWHFKFNQIR